MTRKRAGVPRSVPLAPSGSAARTRAAARGASTRSLERRGRGLRGRLITESVPAWKSRAQKFDVIALAAFEPIETRWHSRLGQLDVAVDEVPMIRALNPESVTWPPEIIADGPVPLSRLVPAGIDKRGQATRARIVLFRRALELRAETPEELTQLVHDILVEQVATYLGLSPDEII